MSDIDFRRERIADASATTTTGIVVASRRSTAHRARSTADDVSPVARPGCCGGP
jgi:hypothetical protein